MTAKAAILDYEAGNLTSVLRAVTHLGFDGLITRDPKAIRDATRVIFPGVGAAGASMENLRRFGLEEEIRRAFAAGKPVLGICIGCQVAFDWSDEDGGTKCLGLLRGKVVRFQFSPESGLKVPHMGWSPVRFLTPHPVLARIQSEGESDRSEPWPQFYFVHSYYVEPGAQDDARRPNLLGTAEYGGVEFPAIVGRDNFVAVQFHTEKSGRPGLRLLENFLRWRP